MRPTVGTVFSLLVIAALTLPARPAQAQAQAPQVFTGTGPEGVATAIASFKAAIGGADNGTTPGPLASGFRQVTWHDVPDSLADPHQFSGNHYLTTSPRGLGIAVGGYLSDARVSANASNPTNTPILFGQSSVLTSFSSQRVFRASGDGFPSFHVSFAVPGSPTPTPAAVSAFGAVFTNVDSSRATIIEFFDTNARFIGSFRAPGSDGHQTLSFVGVPMARRWCGPSRFLVTTS